MNTDVDVGTRQRARITRQGQITVPKVIRDALGARPGDDLEFVRRGSDLLIEVRHRRSVLEFAGLAAGDSGAIPATAEALDALIDQGMADTALARMAGAVRSGRRSR